MDCEIFVSYSRKDSERVLPIVKRLEENGYTCWIDMDGIRGGDAFGGLIVKAIKACMVFLFFSSKDSNLSEWTLNEVSVALQFKKHIIPIKLDDTMYNDDILIRLIRLDFVDLSGLTSNTIGIDRITSSLAKYLGERTIEKENVAIADAITEVEIEDTESNSEESFLCVDTAEVPEPTFLVDTPIVEKEDSEPEEAIESVAPVDIPEDYPLLSSEESITGIDQGAVQHDIKYFKTLYEKAENGDIQAQYELGMSYLRGEYGSNPETGINWIHKSAKSGFAPAQYQLACCYRDGIGVGHYISKARTWLEKAANQNYAIANFELGIMNFYGNGFATNISKARKYFEKAANENYKQAFVYIGICFQIGLPAERDLANAITMYRKAVAFKDPLAMVALAFLLRYIYNAGKPEYQEAYELYHQAADLGNVIAMHNLACLYDTGDGAKENKDLAESYYKKAQDLGYHGVKTIESCAFLFEKDLPKDINSEINIYKTWGTHVPEANQVMRKIILAKAQPFGEKWRSDHCK